MLLGFRGMEADTPELEAMVAGSALADLSQDALESALARAVPRPAVIRKRPFFEDADGARRS
jgi:hypothetical protein